ncbi:MAG: MFS transporter [Dermatophilaceae bacterium]
MNPTTPKNPATRHTTTSLRTATRVFYLLNFTRWFPVGFVVGIFVLIQTGRGLTIAEAMTAAATSGLVCFALELPTSGFADAFGRRAVYLSAAIVNVLAGLAYLFAQNFWQFVGAAALMGTFRALDSGPLEAWFVDTVHEDSPGADVDQELSRAGTVLGLAMAAGALLSGGLIWWHPVKAFPAIDLAVAVFAALNVAHLVVTWTFLRESPRPVSSQEQERRAWTSVREAPGVVVSGLRLLAANRVLRALIGAEIAWSIGMVAFESLLPLRLEELLGTAQAAGALMGPVAAIGWGIFALGTWIAGRASKRWGVARAAMLGRALNALGVLLMAWALTPAGLVAAYLFTYTWHGVNGPPHAALLHREAAARNRSTVLSINSMFAFLAFGIAGPLAGVLADNASVRLAMLVVGVLSLLGVAGYLPARHAERAQGANNAAGK